jgi:hypothetical protein
MDANIIITFIIAVIFLVSVIVSVIIESKGLLILTVFILTGIYFFHSNDSIIEKILWCFISFFSSLLATVVLNKLFENSADEQQPPPYLGQKD